MRNVVKTRAYNKEFGHENKYDTKGKYEVKLDVRITKRRRLRKEKLGKEESFT